MKSKKTYIINILIIALIFISLIAYMIFVDGIKNTILVAKNINPFWVFASCLCMLLYWLIEAYILQLICLKIYKRHSFMSSLRVTMIGQLFNNLTPLSTGGEPVQTYVMVKQGKSLSNSVTILLFKFIIFQSVLVIYTAITLILKYKYFKILIKNFILLAIIGFILSFLIIVALLIVGISKKATLFIVKPIFILLVKFNVIKNKEAKYKKLLNSINSFHTRFQVLKKEKILILKTLVLTFIQLTFFYLVGYTVYRSFGYNENVFINIVSAQAFLNLIMGIVPTPGAGGVAEGSFFFMFSTFFGKNTINMAIFMWRIYTFYLPIIVGAIFMIFFRKVQKKRKKLGCKRYRIKDHIKNQIIMNIIKEKKIINK